MPRVEIIDIAGEHVVHQSIRRWRNRPVERKRPHQIKFHIESLRERAELCMPKGTRYHIALKGDISVVGGVMAACYQSTAQMMFDRKWPAPVVEEMPTADGWIVVFRGVTGK